MKKWYVCYVLANTESKIIKKINMDFKDIEVLYPKEEVLQNVNGKRKLILKPIFPNYMFVRADYENDNTVFKKLIEKTPIIKVLKCDNIPESISDEVVQRFANYKSKIDKKNYINKEVKIVKGPYTNMTGICISIIKGTNEMGVKLYIGDNTYIRARINVKFIECQDNEILSFYEEETI